jgi:hypothetical protein
VVSEQIEIAGKLKVRSHLKSFEARSMISTNQAKNEILAAWVNEFARTRGFKSLLVIKHAEFNFFDDVACERKDILRSSDDMPKTGEWDLIVGDLPIGMKSEFNGRQVSHTLKVISEACHRIAPNGALIVVGEPSLLRGASIGIRSVLQGTGCVLSAILNAPDGLLQPYTTLRPNLYVVTRADATDEFVGEMSDIDQVVALAQSLSNLKTSSTLEQGVIMRAGEFDGFPRWKARQQIHTLQTEYKDYATAKLGDLLQSVVTPKTRESFESKPNCIYVHKVGTKPVTSSIDELTSNHSNYIQCECKNDLVDAQYLESFFCSRIGQLTLSAMTSGDYIPHISKRDLLEAEIAIPPLSRQKEIVNSIAKIRKVREVIAGFENELSLNPISSDQTLKQVDYMLEIVGGLADSDKVVSLIRGGESKQTEFKETLTLDVKKQTKEKYIELSAVKTIAAFMNSSSGSLLVGVADSGEIVGVDNEISKFYKTHDDFLLKFRNLVKERLGGHLYDFIDYRLVKIGDKHVLLVECKESPDPVFVDENDFYVRTNPATDKLDGPKMMTYITNHFVKR